MVERFEQGILRGLAALGEVTSRSLFGGHGLYWRETIFGIIYRGRLYLKVDDRSRDDYVTRGVGPFRPNDRQTLKSYFEVPPEVLADPEAFHEELRKFLGGVASTGREHA